MERQQMKPNIFVLLSTCLEVSMSLLCLFVHEPLYQTVVVCCNPVFHFGSSCMDHPTKFPLVWGSLRLAPTVDFTSFCGNQSTRRPHLRPFGRVEILKIEEPITLWLPIIPVEALVVLTKL